jgi:NTP pyrophosphatase (non-canonical NTP hydrolase)
MAIKLRPEVRRFAEQMELKLRENDHKGGWQDEHIYWLIQRIGDEHKELIEAVLFKTDDVHAIIKECADVANFAMMVADVVHRYGVQNSVPTPFAPDKWRAFLVSTSAPVPQSDTVKVADTEPAATCR